MDKELTTLVERLERIFPHLEMNDEGYYNSSSIDEDFSPPFIWSWYDFIEELKENGLEIRNIKDK